MQLACCFKPVRARPRLLGAFCHDRTRGSTTLAGTKSGVTGSPRAGGGLGAARLA